MAKRRTTGSKSLGLQDLRELMRDGRVWSGLGVVVKRAGESSHFEIDGEDVLVEVDLMPNGEPLLCRLGAGTQGVWKVPAVGSEVMVLIPAGELEAGPMICGVLSSGTVDGDLDGDTLVIVNPGKVIIKSDNDQVIVGGNSGEPIARKTDTVDLGMWAASALAAVTITPPGGGSPITLTPTAVPIIGKISSGSSKAKASD